MVRLRGDREHPGAHRAAARVVDRGVPPRPDQRLLGDVLGQGGIGHHGEGQAEDPRLVPAHEHEPGPIIAVSHACEEGLVRRPVARVPRASHHKQIRASRRPRIAAPWRPGPAGS